LRKIWNTPPPPPPTRKKKKKKYNNKIIEPKKNKWLFFDRKKLTTHVLLIYVLNRTIRYDSEHIGTYQFFNVSCVDFRRTGLTHRSRSSYWKIRKRVLDGVSSILVGYRKSASQLQPARFLWIVLRPLVEHEQRRRVRTYTLRNYNYVKRRRRRKSVIYPRWIL